MELQQQFLELLKIVEDLQKKVNKLEQENMLLIRAQNQLLEWVQQNQEDAEHFWENVEYEIRASKELVGFYPQIADYTTTLEAILKEGKSLARFGDGEFATISGRIRHKFQNELDEKLQQRLLEVLQSKEEKLLIGIADNYGSLQKYTPQAKREIRCYLNPRVRQEHLALLEEGRIYHNAYITRPYVMYADNQTDAPKERFEQLKSLWAGRNCILVEGDKTGMGVGNDLFAHVTSIGRILGPAENAFSQYDAILECCLKQPKDTLFLLALGPAATVLSYDLCKAGYQALDIGHLDLEYEWFLQGQGCRTEVKGKYNNELPGGQQPEEIMDATYKKQVLADFS